VTKLRNEADVKKAVKKILDKHGHFWFMPPANGFGRTGIADIISVHRGVFFAIETKAHNKQMTDRQELTAQVMREAGGAVFLINDETGVEPLKQWLEESK
jgi:hypothetical protein